MVFRGPSNHLERFMAVLGFPFNPTDSRYSLQKWEPCFRFDWSWPVCVTWSGEPPARQGSIVGWVLKNTKGLSAFARRMAALSHRRAKTFPKQANYGILDVQRWSGFAWSSNNPNRQRFLFLRSRKWLIEEGSLHVECERQRMAGSGWPLHRWFWSLRRLFCFQCNHLKNCDRPCQRVQPNMITVHLLIYATQVANTQRTPEIRGWRKWSKTSRYLSNS